MTAAYQVNAYQPNAYQTQAIVAIPAFQSNAFQFEPLAFQMDASPVPPEPTILDGHDAGKKHRKALKKLRELEDARIKAVRDQAEHRKMLIRHAIDPQEKARYEAKIAAEKQKLIAVEGKAKKVDAPKEIERQIEREKAKLEKLAQQLELKSIITAELAKIHEARMAHEKEIARQIRQADDELALMMIM